MPSEVMVLLVIMAVPITAILSWVWVDSRQRASQAGSDEVEQRVQALEAENRELRQRLENVEVIVSDGDWEPVPAGAAASERTIRPRRKNRT